MKKVSRILLLFFCLYILPAGYGYAQNQLVFKNINVDNGLSQNTVMSVLQDNKGYIWVGTFDGLSRFNGLEFKVFKNDLKDPESISNNKINKLFKDRRGSIWAGTIDGLNVYDPDKECFTRFKLNDEKAAYTVLDIAEDKSGRIWVATSDHGLYQLDPKGADANKRLLTKSSICGRSKVTCLFVDDDKMWIGAGNTLKIYDLQKNAFIALPAPLQQSIQKINLLVRDIVRDSEGNYWIGTETNGLFYYRVKDATCHNYSQDSGLLSSTVRTVLEREHHIMWVGTKKGLNIINTQTQQIRSFTNDPIDPNSLSQNSIRCIFKDNENNIWIGTYNGGLNSVYSQYDNFYSVGLKRGNNNGLSYGIVNAIANGNNSDYWIGTDDGGLNHLNSDLQNIHVYYQFNGASRELLGNSIKSIASHPDPNKLWIATGSGLTIFDKRTGAFTPVNVIPKPSSPGFIHTYELLRDEQGLWVATNFSGLYYLTNDGKVHYYQTPENNVTAIYKDGDRMWVGQKNRGLCMLDLSSHKLDTYHIDQSRRYDMNNNAVISIFKDQHKHLWVGTDGGGLNYLDETANRFYSINENQGVANGSIHAILEDKVGRLWVSTNRGLSCITFKTFAPPFDKSTLTIANYSVADGLQSNQFTNGTGIKTPDGNLIFSGINGITMLNPDKIKINNVKPQVVFIDFSIFNKSVGFDTNDSPLQKPIDETGEITLKYSQAFFSIKFAALNYINPEKNQFAFKLEGFSDNDWHYVGNLHIATYTNLDPGTYYFKVKAANNDGIWNENPRVLKITVLPPWYKTWYAFVGYVALIIFLLYLFNAYSKKTERLKNELEFESLSHAKDQELAQKQLSFFANISHEIKTPLTMIMAPIERMIEMNVGNNKVLNQLMLMQRNGERLIRLINQLLDKRKLESGHMHLQAAEGNIVIFVREIKLAFVGLAKAKNITLKFNAKDVDIPVWFDRDKLEKVLYNLLSNAIKFTSDYGKVTVSVSAGDNKVLIVVEDNGRGISADRIDKIFSQFNHYEDPIKVEGTGLGLAFSKELVQLHHGKLSVESRPEAMNQPGETRFSIELPLGKAHLKVDEIAGNYHDSEDILSYTQTEKSVKAQLELKKAKILKQDDRENFSMLIVEDNEDVLNFIKEGFAVDFEVYTAVNGLDGLQLAKEVGPDIIISDVMMPGMNGIELCSKLKSDIDTSHIPVILLTARTQLIFKMEGLETGADDYITKPFNFNMIEARVWNLIENRQKLRERYQKEIKLDPQNIAISNLDEAFLMKVLGYIEHHITDPDLSVEQLSQEVAMSKSSFYKKIKSLTNQTGIEFIRTVRVKRAAQLLEQGQHNVNEVAYMVGFMDVDYFRKCFKEYFGYTPKEHPVQKVGEV